MGVLEDELSWSTFLSEDLAENQWESSTLDLLVDKSSSSVSRGLVRKVDAERRLPMGLAAVEGNVFSR